MSVDAYIRAVAADDISEQLKAAAGPSANVEQLEKDLERWQRTEASCHARVEELARFAQYIPVDAKIDDVIKSEADVRGLLDGFEAMRAEINRRLSILTWLRDSRRVKDEDVLAVSAAIRSCFQFATVDTSDKGAIDAWHKAVAALMRDSSAPLPEQV